MARRLGPCRTAGRPLDMPRLSWRGAAPRHGKAVRKSRLGPVDARPASAFLPIGGDDDCLESAVGPACEQRPARKTGLTGRTMTGASIQTGVSAPTLLPDGCYVGLSPGRDEGSGRVNGSN